MSITSSPAFSSYSLLFKDGELTSDCWPSLSRFLEGRESFSGAWAEPTLSGVWPSWGDELAGVAASSEDWSDPEFWLDEVPHWKRWWDHEWFFKANVLSKPFTMTLFLVSFSTLNTLAKISPMVFMGLPVIAERSVGEINHTFPIRSYETREIPRREG